MSNFNLTYQKDGENEQLYYKDAHNNDLYIRSCEDFAPAIIQEKSGNPIAITDGADCPIRKLKVIFEPIQSGSGDPSPDNIRPISGRDSVTVTRAGKNLLEVTATSQTLNGVTFTVHDGTVTANGTATATAFFELIASSISFTESTILNGCPSGGGGNTYAIQFNGNAPLEVGSGITIAANTTITSVRIRVASGTTLNNVVFKPMIRFSTVSDSPFAPYTAQSVTIQLGQTVYGGTLDVTSGVLTVEWENIASYDGEALPGEWISDRDAYAPGTTPTTGAQVCYKLATPLTIQLTPAQLSTLKGENTFSTNGTSIELEYVVDTKTYIDNLINSGAKTVVKPNDEFKIIDENKGVE